MSRREWIARSRSLLVAVVLLTVPLATDTMSDQDQTVQGASAAGAPVPLPPELARYGETRSKPFLSSYRLPDTITFADSTVPLNVWQVRERIEYEFYRLLEDEGESIILAKRTGRCFPPAERQLAEAGLPDDLKFILLVESKCISAAYSRAKASGPWQFVPSTGRLFSLQNNHWKDDRRNLELSTEAAVKYLKKLHDIFGDWFLAMAAYNTGEVHIRKAMREQRVDDYWKLHYFTETMRYVPRIIASKEIFSQPDKYLGVAKADLYPPLDTEVVTVNVKEDRRHLAAVAEEFGTYFLELKLLNPEIRKDYLPRGTHQIKIPRRLDNGCPMPCDKADEPR